MARRVAVVMEAAPAAAAAAQTAARAAAWTAAATAAAAREAPMAAKAAALTAVTMAARAAALREAGKAPIGCGCQMQAHPRPSRGRFRARRWAQLAEDAREVGGVVAVAPGCEFLSVAAALAEAVRWAEAAVEPPVVSTAVAVATVVVAAAAAPTTCESGWEHPRRQHQRECGRAARGGHGCRSTRRPARARERRKG